MSTVLLIYPYFRPARDRSVFRFPPLGVAYLAASLQAAGHQVCLLDCTFLGRAGALRKALAAKAEIVGVYCMVTMIEDCLWFAAQLRAHSAGRLGLLIAGGPLPTCDPEPFLAGNSGEWFDVVVLGEGEQTVTELVRAWERGSDLGSVAGIAYRGEGETGITRTAQRPFVADLDRLPFPARLLLPNQSYIAHGKRQYGYSITTVMSTRGCPFRCEFCSNVVFGGSYRERSPSNVVDEVESVLGLGYERVSFGDDVFTLSRERVLAICDEINHRGLRFSWECLGRVDALDYPMALAMKGAGCTRIYFGIESGDERILKLMNKKATEAQARAAVEAAHRAGLEVGAFFILFYPGETIETVLRSLRFATSLPLDYLGLTMPYPLPGTALYERVKDHITRPWRPGEGGFANQVVTFSGDFSEVTMWFGIAKGQAQFRIRRRLGKMAPLLLWPFEKLTDALLRAMR